MTAISTSTARRRVVAIDCFPSSVPSYAKSYAIVAIDVIRATTTAVTAVATGRRCFPVASVHAAHRLAARLPHPILAGELGGEMPPSFHMNNSPWEMASKGDLHRPVILLSSSGTQLLHKSGRYCEAAYVACLRNAASLAIHLAAHFDRVAVIGAGSRSEFRMEDQLCCAWIAKDLIEAGFEPLNTQTVEAVRKWGNASPHAIVGGQSADYLRRSAQWKDLDYIVTHINDVDIICRLRDGEVVTDHMSDLKAVRLSPAKAPDTQGSVAAL